MLNKHKSMINV